MKFGIGNPPVGGSQKVAQNQRTDESKRTIEAAWSQTTANLGQVVVINGATNLPVENPGQLSVNILFNDKPFAKAEKIEVKAGNRITAIWRVASRSSGDFTAGSYSAEIVYGKAAGKTRVPLRIVALGGDRGVSSFQLK